MEPRRSAPAILLSVCFFIIFLKNWALPKFRKAEQTFFGFLCYPFYNKVQRSTGCLLSFVIQKSADKSTVWGCII
ncbi:hypothetical protein A0O21_07425 [Streptococcus pantholopis]|uniref:Uncharacterized protein n=1 Tax=Streptococcus pantholopis TaxID=1811193 RepID=A0A172Q8R6_9STRE|nr:hypothetical protein A0O21_07425 [Streptococcus pantholopis]